MVMKLETRASARTSLFPRYETLDLLRGLSVVGMIIFHFVFDLRFFLNYPIDIHSGFWFVFARVTAFSFVFLAGISIPLSIRRKKDTPVHALLVRKGALLL
ncbi:MAG: heparan-alpha-glucosaminide N-acetyltransferase domain-containing protein, partial [archaeon]